MGDKVTKPLLKKAKGEKNKALLDINNFNTKPGSLADSLRSYKAIAEKLPQVYQNYMNEITEGAEDPEAFFSDKMKEFETVLKSYNNKANVSNYIQVHEGIKKSFTHPEQVEARQGALLAPDFFRLGIEYPASRDVFGGSIDKKNAPDMDDETRENLQSSFKAISPSAEDLGFSKELLDYLDQITHDLYSIDAIVSREQADMVASGTYQSLSEDIIQASNNLTKKMTAFLKTGKEADLPTTEDFEQILDSTAKRLSRHDVFEPNGSAMNFGADQCVEILNSVAKLCPELKGRVNVALSKNEEKKEKALKEQKEIIAFASGKDPDSLRAARQAFNRMETLHLHGLATTKDLTETRMKLMAIDPEFRRSEKERAKNAIDYFAKRIEIEKAEKAKDPDHYNEEIGKSMIIANKYGFRTSKPGEEGTREMGDIFSEAYTIYMQAEFIDEEAKKYEVLKRTEYDKDNQFIIDSSLQKAFDGAELSKVEYELSKMAECFSNHENMKKLGTMQPKDVKSIIEEPSQSILKSFIEDVSTGGKMNVFEMADAKSLMTFAEGGDNSDWYKGVANSLRNVRDGLYGKGDNAYSNLFLFNSLRAYVDNHDSKPFTDKGKDRFNAAARIMCSMSYSLTSTFSNSQAEVDIKKLMLRNKTIRDEFIKQQSDVITQIKDRYPNVTSENISQLPKNAADKLKFAIEMVSFGKTAEAHLKGNKLTQITGKPDEKKKDLLNKLEKAISAESNNTNSLKSVFDSAAINKAPAEKEKQVQQIRK